MPYQRPSLTALRNTAIQDITSSGVPGLTGLLRNAVLRVLSWVIAGLAYSLYGYADWIARMGVPFTAQDEYLYAWAALIGIYPEPATPSIGTASFTGAQPTVLPSGTALNRPSDGVPFVTTADGAVDSTGNVTVPIIATVDGAATNGTAGDTIAISQPVAGINSLGTTSDLTGGADQETNDALRTRMLFKYREPPQGGAQADYIEWAEEVPGCTRAWINPNGYGAGSVVVYPMFDAAEAANGGFPVGTDGCASEETRGPTATGDQLAVAEYIWTVQPVTALVYVAAPAPFPVDVTLGALDPNTIDIQNQIIASLDDMFLAVAEVAGIIWPSDLYEAILATPGVNKFEINEPADGVQAPQGSLPILGTVTFPPLPPPPVPPAA
jgi:uncharacterized phage protein gp47/JayE